MICLKCGTKDPLPFEAEGGVICFWHIAKQLQMSEIVINEDGEDEAVFRLSQDKDYQQQPGEAVFCTVCFTDILEQQEEDEEGEEWKKG